MTSSTAASSGTMTRYKCTLCSSHTLTQVRRLQQVVFFKYLYTYITFPFSYALTRCQDVLTSEVFCFLSVALDF